MDPIWRSKGFGVKISVKVYTYFTWADNIYILANSCEQMQEMVLTLTTELERFGFRWKDGSTQYITTCSGQGYLELMKADGTLKVECVTSLEALGTVLAVDGNTWEAVEQRLAAASRKFWALSAILTNKCLSLAVRMQTFFKEVVPSATWGSGGWIWSKSLYSRLKSWETMHLRRILKAGRRPDGVGAIHQEGFCSGQEEVR